MKRMASTAASLMLLACVFAACGAEDPAPTSSTTGTSTGNTSTSDATTGAGGSGGATGAGGQGAGGGDAGGGGGGGTGGGGGPLCAMPPAPGALGSACDGASCDADLSCAKELTTPNGDPLTLGLFGIAEGTPDPAHPGEYIAGAPSPIRVGFAPNGECTAACDPADAGATCGECGFCSATIGGTYAFADVGLDAHVLAQSSLPPLPPEDPAPTAICRARCTFDPATNGGCPDGYTCSASESICVEACVDDAQCNVRFGFSRAAGLVAATEPDAPYTCNPTTGRCEWTAPAGAKWGSPCERDADCPADVGACVKGTCLTYQCAAPPGAEPLAPCDASAQCMGIGAPGASACFGTCTTGDDCPDSYGCIELAPQTLGCFPFCDSDAQCGSSRACDAGLCRPTCDPQSQPTTCGAGDVCAPALGQPYGFCRKLDQICHDDDCYGTQACLVEGNDAYGRCVDGCQADGDCPAGDQCVIHTPPYGVCRTPGGPCSPPLVADAFPLRGDAQCVPGEICTASMPNALGSCAP